MAKKTCENCKYAIISGGDYAPGFGGCFCPEIVDDCRCPELLEEDDLEKILENGELGNCKYWEEED